MVQPFWKVPTATISCLHTSPASRRAQVPGYGRKHSRCLGLRQDGANINFAGFRCWGFSIRYEDLSALLRPHNLAVLEHQHYKPVARESQGRPRLMNRSIWEACSDQRTMSNDASKCMDGETDWFSFPRTEEEYPGPCAVLGGCGLYRQTKNKK